MLVSEAIQSQSVWVAVCGVFSLSMKKELTQIFGCFPGHILLMLPSKAFSDAQGTLKGLSPSF